MTVQPGRLNVPRFDEDHRFFCRWFFFAGSFPLPHPSVLQKDGAVFPLYIRARE